MSGNVFRGTLPPPAAPLAPPTASTDCGTVVGKTVGVKYNYTSTRQCQGCERPVECYSVVVIILPRTSPADGPSNPPPPARARF